MNRINDFLRGMNPTLRELICGIVLWGILFSLAFVWFADSRISFLLSLWAGNFLAAGMAVHMCVSIENSLDLASDDAVKHMRRGTALRMLAAMALFVLAWRLRGNVIAVFLGLITLKLGAYMQPLLHRGIEKLQGRR